MIRAVEERNSFSKELLAIASNINGRGYRFYRGEGRLDESLSLSLIFISRHRLFRKKEQSLRARLSALKSLSRLGSTLDPRLKKFWIQGWVWLVALEFLEQ